MKKSASSTLARGSPSRAMTADGSWTPPRPSAKPAAGDDTPVAAGDQAARADQSRDRGVRHRGAGVQSAAGGADGGRPRSEEHTSELQSLMRISYAVLCLKKKNNNGRTLATGELCTCAHSVGT